MKSEVHKIYVRCMDLRFLAALFIAFNCAARADMVAQFDFHAPSGFLPPSPYVSEGERLVKSLSERHQFSMILLNIPLLLRKSVHIIS